MSDIFISYKREEQGVAKLLADALETQGWSIWWDPQLQAGEYFDDVIEEALINTRCVVVLWSKRSVKSRFVKDEATYALNERKLAPAQIEDVRLPFRFANIHTVQLFGWDGSVDDPGFLKLKKDIEAILNPSFEGASGSHLQSQSDSGNDESTVNLEDDAVELDSFDAGAGFQDKLNDGSQGPAMVVIPAGSFQMGGGKVPHENPRHEVFIGNKFAMGKYPVSFQEYDHFASITDRHLPDDNAWGRYQNPVMNISWHDSVAYAAWLSDQTGAKYRLPTEAEWEYACRAGTDTEYWWGDDIGTYGAGTKQNRFLSFTRLFNKRTTPVGSYSANPFNIHDTSGNVFEWVSDCWHDNYDGAPSDGTPWLEADSGNCYLRILRGGAWDSDPKFMRSAARHKYHPGLRYVHVGFRLARDIQSH